jgi:hypothetical protein
LPSTQPFLSALSSFLACRHHPDLTSPLLDPGNAIDHRRRRPSLELTGKSSTPSRAPTPLHARPLAENPLLNRSATDLAAVDRRSPLGKLAGARNPSSPATPRLHVLSREEERSRAVRSGSDGGVPVRPRQARAGRGSGLAWRASAAPARLFFLQQIDFLFLQTPASFKNV